MSLPPAILRLVMQKVVAEMARVQEVTRTLAMQDLLVAETSSTKAALSATLLQRVS